MGLKSGSLDVQFGCVLFGLLGIGLFSFFVPKKVGKGQVNCVKLGGPSYC